jgi:hypothetical protein
MRIGIRPHGHLFKRWDAGRSPAGLARSFAVWEPLAGRSVARQDATLSRDEPPGVPAQAVLCSPVLARSHASQPSRVGKCRHLRPTRRVGEQRSCRLAGIFLEAATGVEPVIKVLQT